MIQVRHGVFETNSSSSHSISIKKENHVYTKEEIMRGIYLSPETLAWRISDYDIEFGRSPFAPLARFSDKVRFALASYSADKDKIEEICDIFSKYTEGGWINLEWVKVDKDDDWEVDWYGGDGIRGYIDHQSAGLLQNFLSKYNVSLEDFLTNSKYVVWIDGDEYQIKEKLFEAGLVYEEDFEQLTAGEPNEDLEWEEYKAEHPELASGEE